MNQDHTWYTGGTWYTYIPGIYQVGIMQLVRMILVRITEPTDSKVQ